MHAVFCVASRRLASDMPNRHVAAPVMLRITVRDTAMNSEAGMPLPETSATVIASRCRVDQKIIVKIAADLACRVHLGMQVDARGGALAHQRRRQDRLLDLGGRLHFLAAVLLGPHLGRHAGEGLREGGQFARLAGQLVEQRRIVLVAAERFRRIGQVGERAVHAGQAAAELADDRDADRRVFGAEPHQAVLVDADAPRDSCAR